MAITDKMVDETLAAQLRAALYRSAEQAPSDAEVLDLAVLLGDAMGGRPAALLVDALMLRGHRPAFGHIAARRSGTTAALAVAEMASLVECLPTAPVGVPDRHPRKAHDVIGRQPVPASWLTDRLPVLCAIVREDLTVPGGEVRLAASLAELWTMLVDAPAIPVPARFTGGLAFSCACYAADILRRDLVAVQDLAFAPLGSAALLGRALRFDPAGLGPACRNLGSCADGAPPLLALVEEAIVGREAALADHLLMLVTATTPLRQLEDLAGALAFHGWLGALAGLLARAEREGPQACGRPLLWTIRDAALDLDAPALALAAQRLLARGWPGERVERRVLGEMLATLGRREAAIALFKRLARIDPGDQPSRERLEALLAGDFRAFAVRGGYGTRLTRQKWQLAAHRPPAMAGVASRVEGRLAG